ncbi:hypothetical protein [Saccharopolyspora karakumensis]|uniref:hypothetical protein n=1 Tax=Saccharopolyspora karakumensis TaxID=2530386 RepID=UPI00140440C8|nr:hypothetical protein [Saccharopolyspora karakumensis]
MNPTGAALFVVTRAAVVVGWLIDVGEEHTSSAVGGELVVGAGERVVFGAGDSRGVLTFGIGDVPDIIGQRPLDVA